MKKMTCKQLGGACNLEFKAESFEEMALQSKQHGIEMFQKGDEDHIKAMQELKEEMKTPEAMANWMKIKKTEFDSLPDVI